jgi:hypothetical protein
VSSSSFETFFGHFSEPIHQRIRNQHKILRFFWGGGVDTPTGLHAFLEESFLRGHTVLAFILNVKCICLKTEEVRSKNLFFAKKYISTLYQSQGVFY